eukprot:TRINITY_DN3968_c0_g1_i2.p1 TRINITY_DN3968_c0_g1~~TRINITY_DN3968_c0_g1_i2.p1  ORF type:complete len:902 (+),score=271.16 TRINITY_DN3968_c0_g1_i2:132-2837(+)
MDIIKTLGKEVKLQVKLKTLNLPPHLRTVDVRFEEISSNFNKLNKLLSDVHGELSKQKDIRNYFAVPLGALSADLMSFYAMGGTARLGEEYEELAEICNTLIDNYSKFQKEFVTNLEKHLAKCESLKKRIVERQIALLEFDASKEQLRVFHEKGKPQEKLDAADAKLKNYQINYTTKNKQLIYDLNEFYQERFNNFKLEFQELTVRQVMVFNSIGNAHSRLQQEVSSPTPSSPTHFTFQNDVLNSISNLPPSNINPLPPDAADIAASINKSQPNSPDNSKKSSSASTSPAISFRSKPPDSPHQSPLQSSAGSSNNLNTNITNSSNNSLGGWTTDLPKKNEEAIPPFSIMSPVVPSASPIPPPKLRPVVPARPSAQFSKGLNLRTASGTNLVEDMKENTNQSGSAINSNGNNNANNKAKEQNVGGNVNTNVSGGNINANNKGNNNASSPTTAKKSPMLQVPSAPEILTDVSVEGVGTLGSSWKNLWNNYKPMVMSSNETVWTEKNIHDCWNKFNRNNKDAFTKRLIRREGIPSRLRPQIWPLMADIELYRSTHNLLSYSDMKKMFCSVSSEATLQIEKDLTRTFPTLQEEKRPGFNDELRSVLRTYAHVNPQIGYCQSMNFVAATLLFFLTEEQTFWILKIMIDEILPSEYYSQTMNGLLVDQRIFKFLLVSKMPQLCQHFAASKMDIEPILVSWFLSLYTLVFEVENSARVIEQFLYEGDVVLFRIGLAIFKLNEKALMRLDEFTDLFLYIQKMAQTTAAFDFDGLLKKSYSFDIQKSKLKEYRTKFLEEVSREKMQELDSMSNHSTFLPKPKRFDENDMELSQEGEKERWFQRRKTIASKIANNLTVVKEDAFMQRVSERMDEMLSLEADQNGEMDNIDEEDFETLNLSEMLKREPKTGT